jgi:hypothetical protein
MRLQTVHSDLANMERRTFLCWLMSGAATFPLRGVRLHAQAAALPLESLATLRALAPVILPSELRAAGQEKVVNDFVQWLASHRAGAERSWGYGHPRKSSTTAIDSASYSAQLRAIEAQAQARGTALEALPLDTRRELVVAAIEAAGVRELPAAPDGRYVATDVMSFFFRSADGFDLAYRAQVRRATCRGLGGAASKPSTGD